MSRDLLFDSSLVQAIASGEVGVIPTDTVYGLVASAYLPTSVARLYSLKSREHKPGTLIAANIDQLVELGLKRRYLTVVEQYWPGAVSVIIPCSAELDHLSLGLRSLAVRIPDDSRLAKLLEQTGPLQTSSANLPSQPPATTILEARNYFGDKVDFYVDGGDISERKASTVIRIIDDAIEIVRQGAVEIR